VVNRNKKIKNQNKKTNEPAAAELAAVPGALVRRNLGLHGLVLRQNPVNLTLRRAHEGRLSGGRF
jgi:hypothetical protein